jgi:hypothetical protein
LTASADQEIAIADGCDAGCAATCVGQADRIGREAESFATLRGCSDFGGETKRQHHQRLAPIGSDDEEMAPFEPVIELARTFTSTVRSIPSTGTVISPT